MAVEPILTPEKQERLLEWIGENYADASIVRFDDLDAALIGIGLVHGDDQPRLAYSQSKIIEILMDGGMDADEAYEYYDFNIACLYAGPGTPMIVQSVW